LTGGIVSATAGLILWLADPLSVALSGFVFLVIGLVVLGRADTGFAMFGKAAALIGAGSLIGGASVELVMSVPDIAGLVWIGLGGALALGALILLPRLPPATRFILKSIAVMGLALHLAGLLFQLEAADPPRGVLSLIWLYCAAAMAGVGWRIDLRLLTALAVVPFAQMLETGTFYGGAAYVFMSPEPTLTILQMALTIALLLWLSAAWPERHARHARVFVMLAFVTANLAALVGSLWGDVIGQNTWGPVRSAFDSASAYQAALDSFAATTLTLSEGVYAILWALALAAILAWSALTGRRGLFNAAMTFAAIHAYTQVFESFWAYPLTYVIGGLGAIGFAWGLWRLNLWMISRAPPA